MIRNRVSLPLVALIAVAPACSQAKVDTTDREAIEKIVHEYIVEHPEVIEEALVRLSQQSEERKLADARTAITDNFDKIYDNENDFSVGPDDAPVTLVEFFDYRCSYCKRSMEWTMSLPELHDNKVRVVFKDLPILTEQSEKAALAALAAGKQGKYVEMHRELMQLDNSTGFDQEDIDAAAKRAGVDVIQMRADMASVPLKKVIADNKSLARKLGVDGTPAFFVGETHVPGANTDRVMELLEKAIAEAG